MFRVLVLSILSVLVLILVSLAVWFGLGHKTLKTTIQNRPWLTPDYLTKREILASLYREARRKGSLPSSGIATVKKLANDSDWAIRVRALTALFPVRDPQQRLEAIKISLERLKDPEWVVRNYAMRVLATQGAKECIPQILPLLNDPQPEVREEAKKTLQKLGYQVRE